VRERENSVDVTLRFQIIVQLVYTFCKPPSNYKVGTSGFCHLKKFGKVKNPTERKKEKKKKGVCLKQLGVGEILCFVRRY
jgi:hypothetical protein